MNQFLEIPQHSSKTALLASLQQAQDHLLHEPHTPLDLLISIQESIDAVEWENDSKKYFQQWLRAGGHKQLDTFSDAETLFCAGFNYCQEEMEYVFNLLY
ncbi:hypothetical protein [Vibrio parahaemolyticus]|uniref:hypothetical protein n=1 Tax=Vibrio parahaemolyticus TaxID=670 RepID=UPI0011AF756B|nr:hypothetical protein [Vibrio parahaemolyticus]